MKFWFSATKVNHVALKRALVDGTILVVDKRSGAELEFRPPFDPLKHTPEVHVKKILISKKSRPIESLAAAKARVENDARFFKDKLLDLAIQSRTWMRDAATVDKAIDKAFSSPPSDFPASVCYISERRDSMRNTTLCAVEAKGPRWLRTMQTFCDNVQGCIRCRGLKSKLVDCTSYFATVCCARRVPCRCLL